MASPVGCDYAKALIAHRDVEPAPCVVASTRPRCRADRDASPGCPPSLALRLAEPHLEHQIPTDAAPRAELFTRSCSSPFGGAWKMTTFLLRRQLRCSLDTRLRCGANRPRGECWVFRVRGRSYLDPVPAERAPVTGYDSLLHYDRVRFHPGMLCRCSPRRGSRGGVLRKRPKLGRAASSAGSVR